MSNTNHFMQLAIQEAKKAPTEEVPVGAIVVYQNQVIAVAHNERAISCDPTAHAEILALKRAGQYLKRWNLTGCDIFVTLEPCVMCAGAIVNARINCLYYGARDCRFGAIDTVYNIGRDNKSNHTISVVGGVMGEECSTMLTEFFRQMREKKIKDKWING